MCSPWYTPLCGICICHLQYTEVRPVVYRSVRPVVWEMCSRRYGECALVGMGNVLSSPRGSSGISKLAKKVVATGATTPLSELRQRPFHHHDGSSRRPKTDRTPREPDERSLSTHQRRGHRHRHRRNQSHRRDHRHGRNQRHRRRHRHGQNQRHLTATATAAAVATAVAAAASTGGTRALACLPPPRPPGPSWTQPRSPSVPHRGFPAPACRVHRRCVPSACGRGA